MKNDLNPQNNNSGRNPVPSFLKNVGGILVPVLVLYLAFLGATMAVMAFAGVYTGIGPFDSDTLLEAMPQLPLFGSALGYALALILMRPFLQYDDLRFDMGVSSLRKPSRWTLAQTAGFSAVTAFAGLVWSRILISSGIVSLFTGYAQQAAGVFDASFPLLTLISYVVLSPAAEELVFRCCVYRRLRPLTGVRMAMLLSALLFGLWHGNMVQFLYAFLLGLLLAWGYEKSGCIRVCIAAHMCANLLAFCLACLGI